MKRPPCPAPAEIRRLRLEHGLTQEAAGAAIYHSRRAWQDWERGERRMSPALWQFARERISPQKPPGH